MNIINTPRGPRDGAGGGRMTDDIIDSSEVASLLRCSQEQADALMRDGKIKATKIGRGWITLRSRVLEFVTERIAGEGAGKNQRAARAVQVHPRLRSRVPDLPDFRT